MALKKYYVVYILLNRNREWRFNQMLVNRILDEPTKLSESQKRAVLSTKDHIRIIAVVGDGKTETLNRKIVYLLMYLSRWKGVGGIKTAKEKRFIKSTKWLSFAKRWIEKFLDERNMPKMSGS